MANDTVITVIGNLTADPNLRYVGSGIPVVDFTVASTPRYFDKNSNAFKDGDTLFMRCTAWREYAENIAESLTKGTRVIVQGRLTQRSYTPRDGGPERTVVELQVDEVGPALRFARTQITRTPRQGGGFTGGGSFGGSSSPSSAGEQDTSAFSSGGYGAPAGGQDDDPWGSPGTSSFDQDPPF